MPARNIYHNAVVNALTADGWKITDDPLALSYGGKDLYVDLGAERSTIAAEKNGLFSERFGQLIISSQQLRLIVFDEQQERIIKWIP